MKLRVLTRETPDRILQLYQYSDTYQRETGHIRFMTSRGCANDSNNVLELCAAEMLQHILILGETPVLGVR